MRFTIKNAVAFTTITVSYKVEDTAGEWIFPLSIFLSTPQSRVLKRIILLRVLMHISNKDTNIFTIL